MKAGHKIDLVVSAYQKNEFVDPNLEIQTHYIPMKVWPSIFMNMLENRLFNRKAASVIQRIRPTHIHCHDLSTLPSGTWAKKKIGAKLIFDAHELYPESRGGKKERVWGHIERKYIKSCDHIIMPEKNRISYFKKKYPAIDEPILLQNFPRRSDIVNYNFNRLRESYPIHEEQKIILYTGLISSGRYVEELIDSMTMCTDEFALVMIGGSRKNYDEYQEFLRKKIKDYNLENRVFLHGFVPHTELLTYMASADIGTAFYRNTNINNFYCASNKLYEFIALEKVILTNNYPGLIEAVERYNQGVCLTEVTPMALAESYMKANDKRHVTPGAKKFYWEDEENALTRLYD
jgi:glycosyltransferase involved in cell wall biosynthesis